MFAIVIVLTSCGEQTEGNPISKGDRNIWKDAGMRPPERVIVDAPSQLADGKLPEGTFLITVTMENYITRYNEDTIICRELSELESLIDLHGAEELNGHVALQCDVYSVSPNIELVIDLLKEKNIIRFSVVTDLDR